MKILVLADEESKSLYEYFSPEKIKGVDLIISCGDLKASYLTFFATFSHAPLLYVKGNHDGHYEERPPEGCVCIAACGFWAGEVPWSIFREPTTSIRKEGWSGESKSSGGS